MRTESEPSPLGVRPRELILVVDDDDDILELIRYNFAREGYRVITAENGESALKLAAKELPDLILLDLMLPGVSGLDVAKILKNTAATQEIAIVMLTAKGEESDIIVGLELGADDYIVKPFSPKVLAARVRAVLRRKNDKPPEESSALHLAGISIFPERYDVFVEGSSIGLTATEFRILHLMARHPGWVYTRSQIVDAVRGEDYPVTDRSVDVHIVSLRKKLGETYGMFIDTVRGVGYRFHD